MRMNSMTMRWRVIEPMLPNKPRGVPRVDDRRVLNGIFWVLRSGAPCRDLPNSYRPPTTCYNRLVRWRLVSVWDRPDLYRSRNPVERFFNKIKQCRRIATPI
jgi:transposase